MVRAVLDGRKTQTRRLVKNQDIVRDLGGGIEFWTGLMGWQALESVFADQSLSTNKGTRCKYGQAGDRLWVRESIYAGSLNPYRNFYYAADDKGVGSEIYIKLQKQFPKKEKKYGTIPSIHMPRWASRITLEITTIKVERLQDISEEDAIAEGAQSLCKYESGEASWSMTGETTPQKCLGSARMAFANFINQLHGGPNWNFYYNGTLPDEKRPIFDQNPWVWVINFKPIIS